MLEPLHTVPAMITLAGLSICVLAIFIPSVRIIFWSGCILFGLILVFSMIDSIRKYKDIKPALLLPMCLPAQIFGYGLGFIYNFIRRVILKKKEMVGFKISYYK